MRVAKIDGVDSLGAPSNLYVISLDNEDWINRSERPVSEILRDLHAVCPDGYIDQCRVDQWWRFGWECHHIDGGGQQIRICADSRGTLDLHNAIENCLVPYRRVHDDIIAGKFDV